MTAGEAGANQFGTAEDVPPGKAAGHRGLKGAAIGEPRVGRDGTIFAATVGHLVTQAVATDSHVVAVCLSSVQPQQALCRAAHDEAEFVF